MKILRWAAFAVLALTTTSLQATIGPMNYQGRLLDNQGVPVTGSYNFQVRVWDAFTNGTLKYQEDHNGVSVNDGVYSFLVGTQTQTGGDSSWDINLWNISEIYLEIVVAGETLSPRHRIAAAPYAYQANLALTTNNALALGGRTASSYDEIVIAVCEGDSGMWLPTADRCAGGAVDFSGESAASIEPGVTDYNNLVFTNADFTNADFSGINFSGSTFNNTDISNANFSNTGFTSSVWDGVTFSTAPNLSNTNMKFAIIRNMDMSGIALSTASLAGSSIAQLTGCPASLPLNWSCISYDFEGNTRYALVGPDVDLSKDSPAIISKFGSSYLAIDSFSGVNINYANFEGVFIGSSFNLAGGLTGPDFTDAEFHDANFSNTSISSAVFDNSIIYWTQFDNSSLQRTTFIDAELNNVTFYQSSSQLYSGDGINFSTAKLSNVTFDSLNTGSAPITGNSNMDFTNARLDDVLFDTSDISGSDFAGARVQDTTFRDVIVNSTVLFDSSTTELDQVEFLNVSGSASFDFGNATLTQVDFSGSDLSSVDFAGSSLDRVIFDGVTFSNVGFNSASVTLTDVTNWKNVTFTSGADFTGQDLSYTDFTGADMGYASMTWTNVTAQNINMTDADVTAINFANADLKDINFTNARLESANFSSTTSMQGANMTDADMEETTFSGANLLSSDFSNSTGGIRNLTNTDLRFAVFTGMVGSDIDFTGATMQRNNFENASITYSSFDNVTFNYIPGSADVNFRGANLTGTTFVGATLNGGFDWQDATCPDGYVVIDTTVEDCQDNNHLIP